MTDTNAAPGDTSAAPAAASAPEFTPGDIHPQSPLFAHELANKFPMMAGKDMEAHKKSIAKHGQQEPIVMFDGRVLDGRNTLYATLELGKEPVFRDFGSRPTDGPSIEVYVGVRNLDRRHLSPAQRAALAADWIPIYEEEAARRMRETQFKPAASAPAEPAPTSTPALEGAPAAGAEPAPEAAPAGDGPQIVAEEPPAPGATPPPVAKKGKGSAAKQAAAAAGASLTGTKDAARIKKKYPDIFEKIANKEYNLHQATQEEARRDKEAEDSVSQKTRRTERLEAIKSLETRHGKDSAFVRDVMEKRVLKNHKDLLEYADMKRAKAFTILPLVKIGWSPKKAVAYIDAQATADSTVLDLVAMAVMKAGDVPRNIALNHTFVVETPHGQITLQLVREGEATPEPSEAEALAAAADAHADEQEEAEPQDSVIELDEDQQAAPEEFPQAAPEPEPEPQAEPEPEPQPEAAPEIVTEEPPEPQA